MKKLLCILLVVVGFTAPLLARKGCTTRNEPSDVVSDCCACKATSKTFFSVRPQFQMASPELETLFHDTFNDRVDGHNGSAEFVVFGGKTQEPGRLASYFMPGCNVQLRVREVPNAITDIDARQFNIATNEGTFDSLITFAPYQNVVGIGFAYRQAFAVRSDGRQFWYGISTPLTHVTNSVGFFETIFNDGGGALETFDSNIGTEPTGVVANMEQAFRQPSWQFGRIDCSCDRSTTRLADITLELGYEYFKHELCHMESHFGVLIPTGNQVEGKTIFEPIVGHNRHAGLMMGTTAGIEVWTDKENNRSLSLELYMHTLFLFRHKETRLLDVKGKPWSRYMEVYSSEHQAQFAANTGDPYLYTPGVNVFGQRLNVAEIFQRTYNTSLSYESCRFQFEAGYVFFARSPECVSLVCPWVEGPAFKAIEGQGLTNDLITIQGGFINENIPFQVLNKPVEDYASNVITACDLNFDSAAHPAMQTHTIYFTLGYHDKEREYPLFTGVGGSYEISEDNSGLDRWNLWAKFGFSF